MCPFDDKRPVSKEMLVAVQKLFEQYQPNFFVTLAFNRGIVSDSFALRLLSTFFWDLDRKLGGKNCWLRPEARLDGAVIMEKWVTNSHIHALIRVPEEAIGKFSYRAEKFWKKGPLGQSRTINIQRIYDLSGAIRYVTKEIHYKFQIDRIVLISEIRRNK